MMDTVTCLKNGMYELLEQVLLLSSQTCYCNIPNSYSEMTCFHIAVRGPIILSFFVIFLSLQVKSTVVRSDIG